MQVGRGLLPGTNVKRHLSGLNSLNLGLWSLVEDLDVVVQHAFDELLLVEFVFLFFYLNTAHFYCCSYYR